MPTTIPSEEMQPATASASAWRSSVWTVVAAFGAYFCVYAFRKPFTASSYDGIDAWGFGYKSVLVGSQTIGYALSKVIGVKVVSEASPARRVVLFLGLVSVAALMLLLFAITPPPYGFVWMFFNGLSLGIIFGLVLGFLEGRRNTEALAAGLCVSFVCADGATRSVGSLLLREGVTDAWMPIVASLLFAGPLLAFAWMLTRIAPPTREDVAERCERVPMNSADRREFFRRHALGLSLIFIAYTLVTVLRSLRSDFAKELWTGLGIEGAPHVFWQTELIVGFAILVMAGATVAVRDNRRAFNVALGLAGIGAILLGVTVFLVWNGTLSPFAFMVLVGLGLYLPYITVHTTIFERLIAMTRDRGNIGYLMYVADACGYIGFVVALLGWNWVGKSFGFVPFFLTLSGVVAVACVVLFALSGWLFAREAGRSAHAPLD